MIILTVLFFNLLNNIISQTHACVLAVYLWTNWMSHWFHNAWFNSYLNYIAEIIQQRRILYTCYLTCIGDKFQMIVAIKDCLRALVHGPNCRLTMSSRAINCLGNQTKIIFVTMNWQLLSVANRPYIYWGRKNLLIKKLN